MSLKRSWLDSSKCRSYTWSNSLCHRSWFPVPGIFVKRCRQLYSYRLVFKAIANSDYFPFWGFSFAVSGIIIPEGFSSAGAEFAPTLCLRLVWNWFCHIKWMFMSLKLGFEPRLILLCQAQREREMGHFGRKWQCFRLFVGNLSGAARVKGQLVKFRKRPSNAMFS